MATTRRRPTSTSRRRATSTEARASFDAATEAAALERRLRARGTAARAAGSKAYLKSALVFTGTDVPTLRAELSRWHREHRAQPLEAIVAFVDDAWRRGVFELQLFAAELLVLRVDDLTPSQLPVLEQLLRHSHTWALVDVIAPRLVGPLLEAHPVRVGRVLDRWATDADFWIRRAALLALLLPMRRGDGDWRRFSRYAGALAEDREFFVRKAIGWLLREAATRQPAEVVAFLTPRAGVLSGVTWREAVRKLPAATQARLDAVRTAVRRT